MTGVWSYSKAQGTDLLVLLALADIANDEGECWPSISYISKKCRIGSRTAQRHIRNLAEIGEVVVIFGGGKASKAGGVRSNHYRITVFLDPEDAPDPVISTPCHDDTPVTDDTPDPVSVDTQTLSALTPDTSLIHQVDTSLPELAAPVPATSTVTVRDHIFDTLCDVCGIDSAELNKSARGSLNAALRSIRESTPDVTTDEIEDRASEYRKRFTAPLTAPALAKHWPALGTHQPSSERGKCSGPSREPRVTVEQLA